MAEETQSHSSEATGAKPGAPAPKIEQKTEAPKAAKAQAKVPAKNSGKIVVVLVRGLVEVRQTVRDTLALMKLSRVNQAVVVSDSAITRGMLQKAKDYITWGTIDDATFKAMVESKGEEFQGRTQDSKGKYTYNKFLEVNGKKYKKTFRLNPPKKGFGRKGIKMPFKNGGALGNRQEKINDLVKRML